MIDFNLPRTRFVDENSISRQLEKIAEELDELFGVTPTSHHLNEYAHEAVDLMQAVQTLLHMLAEKHGVDVPAVIAGVVKKNSDRGYYNT